MQSVIYASEGAQKQRDAVNASPPACAESVSPSPTGLFPLRDASDVQKWGWQLPTLLFTPD